MPRFLVFLLALTLSACAPVHVDFTIGWSTVGWVAGALVLLLLAAFAGFMFAAYLMAPRGGF